MKHAGILGLGLWVPDEVRTNDAWPDSFRRSFEQQRDARRAVDFTDVEANSEGRPHDEVFVRHALPHDADPFKGATRRRVAPDDTPTVLGDTAAAVRAMEDAAVRPRDIDLVLSSAMVPDRLVPSNGPSIQALAGCVNAAGLAVESYCSSALSQLDLAAGLVEAGRARFVLCVQSHQIGRTNDLELPFSPIFGDASAAFVVGEVPSGRGLRHVVRRGDGALAGAVTWTQEQPNDTAWWRGARGPVRPGSDDLSAARRFTKNLVAYAVDTIGELCERTSFPIREVGVLATMQPVVWYQPAIADALSVPAERVPSTYDQYAHLGGAGVVANLLEARRRGLLHDDVSVIAYAHGAGMTRYAALLRW